MELEIKIEIVIKIGPICNKIKIKIKINFDALIFSIPLEFISMLVLLSLVCSSLVSHC
jgi:hypothetical protein